MARINPADIYYGAYVRFDTVDKRDGAALNGPDNAVGDIGNVVLKLDQDQENVAWLENAYGTIIGYLDSNTSHRVALFKAKDWTVKYILSFVACTSEGEGVQYWGQVALIAYGPRFADEISRFIPVFAKCVGEGFRPDPQLNVESLTNVIANPEKWEMSSKVKIPKSAHTAILKDHRTEHDKLLDQARAKNKGCYAISWLFIIALVALAAYILHQFGVF